MKTHLRIADKTHVGKVDDERLVALLEHRVELHDVFRGRSLAQRERHFIVEHCRPQLSFAIVTEETYVYTYISGS